MTGDRSVSDERLRQAVREVLAEELDDDAPTATRRQVLGSIAAGGVLGGVAGAGSASAATSTVGGTPASLGTVATDVYKWADPGGLSGPEASRSNANNYDTGRIHISGDTGQVAYDTGSGWDVLPVDAPEVNNVLYAEPGELQSVLNDAAGKNGNYFFGGWPVVRLGRGLSYTSPPYTIPQPVVLDLNGAEIGTNQQVNLLEPDPGSTLIGPGVLRVNTDPYTESVLYLDSSKGKFSPKGGGDPFSAFGHFHIEGPDQPALGDQTDLQSNGIYFDATSDTAITNLELGSWTIKQMHNCVLANTNDGANSAGFVNNVRLRVEGVNCNRYWRHAGDYGAKVQFVSGSHVQGGDFDRVFYNTSGQTQSCTFSGHMEDVQRVGTSILDGPGMKIHEERSPLQGNLAHPYTFDDGSTWNGVADLPNVTGNPEKSANVTPTAYMPGEMIHTTGGVYRKMIDPSGSTDPFEKLLAYPLDLSTINSGLDGTDDGDLFRHDGTANSFPADGGTTSAKGLYVWDNSATEFTTVVAY